MLGQRWHQRVQRESKEYAHLPANAPHNKPPRKQPSSACEMLKSALRAPAVDERARSLHFKRPGLNVKLIEDVTPIPHNGCRPQKETPRLVFRSIDSVTAGFQTSRTDLQLHLTTSPLNI